MNEEIRQHRLGHSRSLLPRYSPSTAALGDEFYPILNSYVIDTGKGDNFCDNNVLRRSCFRAVERFALARPDLASKARGPLQAGLRDEDPVCREIAREALGKIGMFRGAGGGMELEGGRGTFLEKGLPPRFFHPAQKSSAPEEETGRCRGRRRIQFL